MNTLDIKFKAIIAYEAQSSITQRLTPADVGKLVTMIPTKAFDAFSSGVIDSLPFTADDRKSELVQMLTALIDDIEDNSCSVSKCSVNLPLEVE